MKGGFNIGDIVRLKSGGPKMTVTCRASESIGVTCCWFVSDQERRATFPTDALQHSGGTRLTGDAFEQYETILQRFPVSSIDVHIHRLTEPLRGYTAATPRSVAALQTMLKRFHGESDVADYEVRFVNNTTKQWLGKGKVTMPDTRSGSVQKKSGRPR